MDLFQSRSANRQACCIREIAIFLYIGLAATDEKRVQRFTGHDIVNGDHLEVWIDYDYRGDKDVKVAEDDFQLGFSPGNADAVPPSITYWFPDSIADAVLRKIEFASQQSEGGYT